MGRYCVSKYSGIGNLITKAFAGRYFEKISEAVAYREQCAVRNGDTETYFEVCDLQNQADE